MTSEYTQVIRCKDCRYFKREQELNSWGYCRRYFGDEDVIYLSENDFCSRGDDLKKEGITLWTPST